MEKEIRALTLTFIVILVTSSRLLHQLKSKGENKCIMCTSGFRLPLLKSAFE